MINEDDEFRRSEGEVKLRAMLDELPEAIPFITREQLLELFKDTDETKPPSKNT